MRASARQCVCSCIVALAVLENDVEKRRVFFRLKQMGDFWATTDWRAEARIRLLKQRALHFTFFSTSAIFP
jgi:hypothetical protein